MNLIFGLSDSKTVLLNSIWTNGTGFVTVATNRRVTYGIVVLFN